MDRPPRSSVCWQILLEEDRSLAISSKGWSKNCKKHEKPLNTFAMAHGLDQRACPDRDKNTPSKGFYTQTETAIFSKSVPLCAIFGVAPGLSLPLLDASSGTANLSPHAGILSPNDVFS